MENFLANKAPGAGGKQALNAAELAAARAVRGAVTSEMYEEANASWLEMRGFDYDHVQRVGVQGFCDWIKMRSHLFRGVTFGTMLRGEAYHFLRLGTHLERADNTARILDTKYHILLPSAEDVGGAVDYYQWQSLLTSVSGFEAYRRIYSDVITPRRVAELLILRRDMPRSLHRCVNELLTHLAAVANDQSDETLRRTGALQARLRYGRIDQILEKHIPMSSRFSGLFSRPAMTPWEKIRSTATSRASRIAARKTRRRATASSEPRASS